MSSEREKILILEPEGPARQRRAEHVRQAGYEVIAVDSAGEGLAAARTAGIHLLLLDAGLSAAEWGPVLTELKGSAVTRAIRVILLTSGAAAESARGLDLGADDVAWLHGEPVELLARIRAQLRARREQEDLRRKVQLAEEGQQIAHTAFQALAVTEKMTRDAFSLDRRLKIGLAAVLLVAAVMAGIFFLYSRRAEKETQRAYAVIAQLERGLAREGDLIERSRRMREEMERSAAGSLEAEKRSLEQRSEELRARMPSASTKEVASLRRELAETSSRLRRIESQGKVAQGIIRSYAPSVCLLHVVVGFRHKASGQRLRYAGINPEGEPLQDSEGNPIFDLEGRGPEVRADFFGTGFLAAPGGRILTNRHVVEPWWKNEELTSIERQGLEAVIVEISAYFPDSPRAYRVEIQKTSPEADLAVVQGDLGDLKRGVPTLDGSRDAAVSGRAVVLLGYPTGLDAILARAGEDTVRSIVASADGSPKQIMSELARRNLIRPVSTQGHIGDVLGDKIVYDAQTTSGGSGGPLFNAEGKVIGVNFAVVRGFGGSNFGIPIRYAEPLLGR